MLLPQCVRVCMQLLDLSVLDITSRQFAPSVLATSAMYLVLDSCRQHLKLFTGREDEGVDCTTLCV